MEHALAHHLAALRHDRGWSLEQLAQASGISKATLSRIENTSTSPTASQLNNLAGCFSMTLSQLLAVVERNTGSVIRADSMQQWQDPQSGYQRRSLSPPTAGFLLELLEVTLPAKAKVVYDKPSINGLEQHFYVQEGQLHITVENEHYALQSGDVLRFHLYGATQFFNPGSTACRYLLALHRGG